MYLIWSLTILLGLTIWSSQCCILKNGCRFSNPFSDPSLVFAGRMVFDTPTGTLNGKRMEDEKHIIIIPQPRLKMTGVSLPVHFRGSGLGKVWRAPNSNPATFCKASPLPDTDCFLPPGPPRNLEVDVKRRTHTGIQIVWERPTVTNGNILKYEIRYRAIERPYDSSFKEEAFEAVRVLAHTLQKLEHFLENLDPSTKYEVQLSALTFIKKGPCITTTGSTKTTRDLEPVDVNVLPPLNRTEGETVVIYLPPLTQKYATGYIIKVVVVRGRDRVPVEEYRAAFINKTDETAKFTVGDGEQYGEYINRPLREDENYEVYIGVVSKIGEVNHFYLRTFDRNKRRIKKGNYDATGNRRNLALPEIPTDVERYKLFTSSAKSQEGGCGLHVPLFDPYGVDFAPDSDEIMQSNKREPHKVSAVSTGVDIARIQNRRLPEKPPPIHDNPTVTLGTYVKSQTRHTLGKSERAVAETDGMTEQFYRSEDEGTKKSTPAFQDEYDDTDVDKETEKRQSKKQSKKNKQNGMVMSTFSGLAGKNVTTSIDYGDTYDDTDVDKVTEGKKSNDLRRDNECRYSKYRGRESSTSVIYEDALDSLQSSAGGPTTLLADVYEETENTADDDFYDDTEELSVDRKMLSQEKEPSTENSAGQNTDGQKPEKNKSNNKRWFQWKRKDVSVTENLGKNNTKMVPTAEVSPIQETRVNYSDHLYPLSSGNTDKTPGEFLGGEQADDDEYNDIYEDTTQMVKKESIVGTFTHPRPPSNPPQPKTNGTVKKWTGMTRNNTAQNTTIQPDRKLGEIKDYGDEYDETAVESKSDSKVTMTTAPPASILLPPKPIQAVIPSFSMVENSKTDCHGNAGEENDEELYEQTGEVEMYDDTSLLDHDEELYEAIQNA
ncbi:Receptor-type tyrosine-protein phosphatase T [Holothuria leucospilota]|uniref:Receptor-type tyrosine-protein phosphatase T n=1 Tax=Holothuria leucospilota TaxID=206669 RepID=A0A9Q1BLU2_HOLLE|nr:Receptor-type tyrosine-protein phosphatase T [Holothuria leucospilota]